MKTVLNKKNIDPLTQPMFLGEDLALQRYDKLKYPKFYDLYLEQKEQNWMPFEYGLSKDRSDYETLTPEERFVFESNLRWQTLTDSCLSRSIHQISEYITNPELEICCTTWADFECVHSLSYTWILQNLVKSPDAFFNSILEDKHIVKRAHDVSQAYDKLLDKPENLKQKIFDAVLSTQITEGLAFYISFACTFWFGYRGKMVGNADIVRLIHKDERLHVAITQNIMKYWRENKEEGFQDIVKQNEQKIYDMYGLAVQNEKEWAQYLFSQGPLMGLNEKILGQYVEWLANRRLTSLGYKKIFDQPKNPIAGWLDSYIDGSSVQVAPQEQEIGDYIIGRRDTSIEDSDFENFEL